MTKRGLQAPWTWWASLEFDYDFLDGVNANPSYSTQPPTLQEKTMEDNNMLEAA